MRGLGTNAPFMAIRLDGGMLDTRRAPFRRMTVVAVVAMAMGCAGVGRGGAATDPNEREWIQLFDGRTLNGWIPKFAKHDAGENFANTFRVRDGTIEARYDQYGGDYAA